MLNLLACDNLIYLKFRIMKTIKAFFFLVLFTFAAHLDAQVNVNVNLGTPPAWAHGNAVATQYYYLPEINSYYDVPSQQFLYLNNGKWVKAKKLPGKYKKYNLNKGKIIYLSDYRGNAPYNYNKKHKAKYVMVGPNVHPVKYKKHKKNTNDKLFPKKKSNKHKNHKHKK